MERLITRSVKKIAERMNKGLAGYDQRNEVSRRWKS